jgi:DMSO/TMAO reductase YedYZ molybdopterin-dependent catalytic subunit
MVKKVMTSIVLIAMIAFIIAISGCTQSPTSPTPTAAPSAAPSQSPAVAVLNISGNVPHPLNLTMGDLKGYEAKTITVPDKDNVTMTYTGVSYNTLLNDSAPASDATSVNMLGSDGYSYSIDLSAIRSSPDAIIAINADDTLKAVIPGQSKGAWVGNLTAIEIT